VLTVNIKNVGSGIALIRSVKYRVVPPNENKEYDHSYDDVIETIAQEGYENRKDFVLLEFSNGFALSPKDEKSILEVPISNYLKGKTLDIKIEFEGFLGDRYCKEIFCIPRKGI